MSQLLDSDFEQQPDSDKDLEILRSRIFIMAAVCGLLWLNLRYFLLDEIILWSKPVVGANEEYSMAHLFVNMTYLTILLLFSFLFITFSIESTKKHFRGQAIASIIIAIISAAAAWLALIIVGMLISVVFYVMGFP